MLNQTNAAQANNSNTSTIQPMRFGELLDTTFSLYRKHFLLFLSIISVDFCGNLVEYLLKRFLPNFPLKYFGTDFVSVPFALISMGGIIVATATIYLGGDITSRDALKQTGRRFWHILACHLPWSLVFVMPHTGVALLIFSVMGIDVSLSHLYILRNLISLPFSIYLPIDWSRIIGSTLRLITPVVMSGSLWIQLILSVLVLFLFYFMVRWLFATTAVLLDIPRVRPAFKRSGELTRRNWWRVLGILVSLSVLSVVIQRIGYVSIGLILTLTKLVDATRSIDIIRLMVVSTPIDAAPLFHTIMSGSWFVVGTLIIPIWVIGITLLYLDLQIRNDGFNVEMSVNNTAN